MQEKRWVGGLLLLAACSAPEGDDGGFFDEDFNGIPAEEEAVSGADPDAPIIVEAAIYCDYYQC